MLPELHTRRCRLQQVAATDQAFIYAGFSHPQVTRYMIVRYDSFEATGEQMKWYEKNFREDTGGAWKVTDRQSGEPMGVVSYYYHRYQHRKAEIGFWFLPEYWGRGFGTEAVGAVVEFCAREKKIHRLEAFVEPENQASSGLLRRLGFACEGRMRECEIRDGEFLDLEIYALLLS